jgi:hypothetical protein
MYPKKKNFPHIVKMSRLVKAASLPVCLLIQIKYRAVANMLSMTQLHSWNVPSAP